MITARRDMQGPAGLYATFLVIYCSRESMAALLEIGLACKTTLELADLRIQKGVELEEPYELLTQLVASNLTTSNEARSKASTEWAARRCARAEEQGLLGVTYLNSDEDKRVKHYFLTDSGENEFGRLQAEFQLAYLKPNDNIIGFSLIRRT